MSDRVRVVVKTVEGLRREIEEIEAEYPWMPAAVVVCCEAHLESAIRREYGDDAAAAFRRRGEAMFLLGATSTYSTPTEGGVG